MKKFGLLFCFTFLTIHVQSQKEYNPVFRTIVPENLGVKSIAYQNFDEYGRMWAISDEGLFMFDGFKKTIFKSSSEANAPISDKIRSLQKLNNNEFWITYNDNFTISSFNPITLNFKHFRPDSLNEHRLPPQTIVKVVYENDSIRWVLTWGEGICRLNINNEYVQRIVNESVKDSKNQINRIKDIIPCNYVKEFIKIDDENYLVAFFNEYAQTVPHIYNRNTQLFTPIDFSDYFNKLPTDQIQPIKTALSVIHFIHVDVDQNFWIGTYTGLMYMNRQNQTITRITHKSNNLNQQNLDNTRAYILDENENLWISTPNQGIMYVDKNTKHVSYIQTNIYNATSIKDNRIRSVNKDNFGNIWVSTESGNMSVYNPLQQKFQIHPWSEMDLDFTNRSEQTVPVNQILVLENGTIFISNANGLVEYNSNLREVSSTFNRFSQIESKSNIDSKMILHFRRTENELIFVSSINANKHHKVFLYNSNTKKARMILDKLDLFLISLPFRHASPKSPILFYSKRSNKSMLLQFDLEKNILDTLNEFPDGVFFSERFTLMLPSKNWLIPTDNGKLIYYYPNTNEYDLYSHQSEKFYFPDSSVNCGIVDNKNQIWIGTNNGLYLFNESNKEFEKRNFQLNISEKEKVSSLIQDDDGIYWIALEKDLIRWDKSKNEIFRYNQSHGLQVGNFLPAVAQKDTMGNIYIATYYGILKFNPSNIQMPDFDFEIKLASLEVMDSSRSIDNIIKDGIELDYDENFLNFDFYTNQIFSLQPHEFYYRLVGRDNEWQNNGISNKVRLADLSYGEYKLEIKATNGYYQETNVLSIPIIIAKPYYLTWWFISLIILIVSLIIWAYIKYREKALRKKSEELETIVAERTAEVVQEKQEADKQRLIAEHQKEIVEEKQKEIADSIAYAKRIQNAILPSHQFFRKYFPDNFIFYLPKDVVAGDFYWMETVKNIEGNFTILAVADCTGHGVPGAMVSVVCHNALTRAVNEFNLYYPNEILNKTRELVIETFSNNDEQVNDGMDISLISINTSKNCIYFSGANNGLLLIRNNELQEFKPDKQPIGNYIYAKPFQLQTINFEKGDQLYLYSDGYADQFGGEAGKPGGKKFKFSRLKTLFTEIASENLNKQHAILNNTLLQWRGEIEQIDDICIIGVKL